MSSRPLRRRRQHCRLHYRACGTGKTLHDRIRKLAAGPVGALTHVTDEIDGADRLTPRSDTYRIRRRTTRKTLDVSRSPTNFAYSAQMMSRMISRCSAPTMRC